MPAYYMLHDPSLFQEEIVPALSASWRQRNFAPSMALCQQLAPQALEYCKRYYLNPSEPLLFQVAQGIGFDRDFWILLAGEIFLFAARDIPWIPQGADTLCELVRPSLAGLCAERSAFTSMQRACFGGRDLAFGTKLYLPHKAGWNSLADVHQLAGFLRGMDEKTLEISQLHQPDLLEEDAQDELAIARDCLAALRELYDEAARKDWILLIEQT